MTRPRDVALVLIAALSLASAQTETRAVDWLRKHAIPMRTLAPGDPDLSDLEPLAAMINDARIVLLGEQSHGDGTTFLGKNRLIAFLHQRMGFDVLCFESGLFDCRKAWEALRAGEDALPALKRGIFSIWLESRQLEPLTEYVGRAARTARPLEICGYDCQLTGRASRESLISDLQAILKDVEHPALTRETWASAEAILKELIHRGPVTAQTGSSGAAALATIADVLASPSARGRHAPRELAFWRQLLESLSGLIKHQVASDSRTGTLAERFNPRDEQGARNLVWLAREHYPDRKIIVWAASMHLLRDHGSIDTLDPKLDYTGVRSMGHHASSVLGRSVFVMAFTAGGGEAGIVGGSRWKVPPATAGSFEDLCTQARLGNAIIPVVDAPDAPFHAPILARPLGYQMMRADWKRHVDAFVFTSAMTPSRQRYSKDDVDAMRDIVAALERAAQGFKDKAAKGHPYADKGGLESEWERWVDMFDPEPESRRIAVAKVHAWAAAVPQDPALTWRIHQLLSAVAADEHDLATALSEIDAAMASYPDSTYPDASKQSSYQHLANEKAMILIDKAGFDAALSWIASALETDRRFRFFHPVPWLEKFDEEPERCEQIRKAIGRAYEKRAENFPDERERLASDWEATQKIWPR